MQLIENRQEINQAEKVLLETQDIVACALGNLKQATITCFHRFWNNDDATPEEMGEKMGSLAEANFTSHQNTILFLMSQGIQFQPSDYTPTRSYHFENGRIIFDD